MKALVSWIRQQPFATFVILACALSWWMTPLGIEGLPALPLGPLLAALIVVPIIRGREGLKEWTRSGFHWRIGLQWYAVAIAFPIVMNAGAAGVNILLGATASTAVWPTDLMGFLVEALITILIVAVGEEMGFSAFALPHLLRKYSVLATAVIVGLTRVLWHVPLFIVGETAWPVALLLFPAQLVFTWIFVRSGGSAFLIILSHGVMASVGFPFFTAMFSGQDLTRMVWLQVAAYTLAAAFLLITSRALRSGSFNPDENLERKAPAVLIP